MNDQNREKLLNLMADEVIFGLTESEMAEMETLKKQFPDLAKDTSFDMAAGQIMLSEIKEISQMPERLKKRIITESAGFFDESKDNAANAALNIAAQKEESSQTSIFSLNGIFSSKLGWAFAAAACVALFAILVFDLRQPTTIYVKEIEKQKVLTNSEQYEQLVANAEDLERSDLFDPADGEKKIGELVWSEKDQKGYMVFDGLAVNDASKETYQLWIFDESQDEKTPIDGGVFDISDGQKPTVIPINAKLNVVNPSLFAVTVEKPGGVVVSKREKIVALAKMSS